MACFMVYLDRYTYGLRSRVYTKRVHVCAHNLRQAIEKAKAKFPGYPTMSMAWECYPLPCKLRKNA